MRQPILWAIAAIVVLFIFAQSFPQVFGVQMSISTLIGFFVVIALVATRKR